MAKTIYSKEYKRLVEKLKKARIECGLSQIEVGNLFKKGQAFISKVEAGQQRLDVIELCKFAKIYKKNIKYFLP